MLTIKSSLWYRCARLWKLRSLDLFGPSLRDIKSYFRLKWVKLKELGHEMWCFFVFFYIISVLWKLNLWKWGSSRRLQCLHLNRVCDRIVAFNITFNNILVISWRSVLLVEETGVPRENHRPGARQDLNIITSKLTVKIRKNRLVNYCKIIFYFKHRRSCYTNMVLRHLP
jgi:hypothetical protein